MDEQQQQPKADERFDARALVELFGHQRIAGRVSEQTIGGCSFIRVDVPAVGDVPAYTRLFGNGAIYGMTITTEAIATRLADNMRAKPINAYDIAPRQPAIGYAGSGPEEDDEYPR